jgi:hypothetical protein
MPVRIWVLALLILIGWSAVGLSQDQQHSTTVVYDDDASMPSMELLEFLGEWETEDGEWLDPILLDEMMSPERESSDE